LDLMMRGEPVAQTFGVDVGQPAGARQALLQRFYRAR
jgi:hypothetical protein